jgi:beta-aspartyl-peptidase (threonine type)
MTITGSWLSAQARFGVLVHGGAGRAPPDRERFIEGCRAAAQAGAAVLREGGAALDAVQCAVEALEDNSLFNAGTGAALTRDGHVELDASIMEGTTLRAGAVCSLPPFRNPIAIARAVLEDGRHVLYAADGAAQFALRAGFCPVPEQLLITEAARLGLARVLREQEKPSGGTVGAVAFDTHRRVAAATSTGGTTAKRHGRVGDSPILGAGTYADDTAGAASATGEGEGILRVHLTGTLVAAMRQGMSAEEAARHALELLSARISGTAGVVAADSSGRLGFARSTDAMPWAAVWENGSGAGD